MVVFLRSQLYLNFWLFVLKGAAAVTLITCACIVIPLRVMGILAGNGVYEVLIPVALAGIPVGFGAAFVGFWLMYFTLKFNPRVKLSYLGLVTGTIFAAAAWQGLTHSGYTLQLSQQTPWAYLFLPILPMMLCVYAFMRFTEKHLSETARSATEPATVSGIF